MTLRSGDRVATGTGANRRRLTLEEAQAGALPELMTREEWDAMAEATHKYHARLYELQHDNRRTVLSDADG